MKKIRQIFSFMFSTASVITLSCCGLHYLTTNSVVSKKSTSDAETIPDKFFNITSKGVLKGFLPSVTPSLLWGYTKMVIPAKVVEIENNAFCNMFDKHSSLRHLILNQKLKKIGACAFSNCYAFGNGITPEETGDIDFSAATNIEEIGNEAFSGIQFGTENFDLSSFTHLKTIGTAAFRYAEFKKIKFPSSLVNVGSRAFCDCAEIITIDMTAYNSIPTWMYNNKNIFWNINSKEVDKKIIVNGFTNSIDEWKEVFERQKIKTTGEKPNFIVESVNATDNSCFTFNNDNYITGLNTSFDPSKYDILRFPAKNNSNLVKGINWNNQSVYEKLQSKQMRIEFEPESTYSFSANTFKGFVNLIGDLVLPTLTNAQSIGESAFEGCTNITSIDFTKTGFDSAINEIHLEKNLFKGCTQLKNIIFPDIAGKTVKFFADTFTDCINLSCIDLKECSDIFTFILNEMSDTPFKNISKFGVIFCKNKIEISKIIEQFKYVGITKTGDSTESEWFIHQKPDKDSQLKLSDYATTGNYSLHTIKSESLLDLDKITTISIPESILYIEANAFKNILFVKTESKWCNWDFRLNNGLQEIRDSAFANCNHLSSTLDLPKSLTILGDKSFYKCNQLRGSISIPNLVTSIGSQCFAGCSRLNNNNLVLPSNLTYIGGFAFADTPIPAITIPKLDHDLTLDSNVFLGMNELSEIYLNQFEASDIAHLKGNAKSMLLSKASGKIYVKTGTKQNWKTHLESLGLITVDTGEGWCLVEK